MRLFKIEDFREVKVVNRTHFMTIRPLIKEVLAKHKTNDDEQTLFCLVEQIRDLNYKDVSYLVAINNNSAVQRDIITIVGDYREEYLHNLLFCCEFRSLELVFKEFLGESQVQKDEIHRNSPNQTAIRGK